MLSYKRIVIKVGSNVLTTSNGQLDTKVMVQLMAQIALAKSWGYEIILVSSGAVAAGRSLLPNLAQHQEPVAARQVWAAIGQVQLMKTYQEGFAQLNLHCAQVLVTKEDFRDRLHYLNMKQCFKAFAKQNIVPIINENDVIAVTELMFTDNDELAGLIAAMTNADAVLILTNVDGIYNAPPSSPNAQLISRIETSKLNFAAFISAEKSGAGRGGMITKSNTAKKLARLGIAVHIANGKNPTIIEQILQGQPIGTFFVPQTHSSPAKRWIAHTEGYAKGMIYINEGATNALTSENKVVSILPVGVVRLEGNFQKGDIVRIAQENGHILAIGKAAYGAEKAKEKIGKSQQKPLVHYDFLFIL